MGLGGAVEAGKAFVKFVLEDKEFKKSLRGIGTQMQNFGKTGLAATGPLLGVFGGAAAAAVSVGDALGDMATRTGVSAEALSQLSYAAAQSGTNIDTVERGIRKMQVNVGNASMGVGTFGQTLAGLGVDLQALQTQNPEQQFMTMARAVGGIADPATRAALAQKVFGKAGAELLPLLSQGADGLDALRQSASDLGVTMSTEDVAAAQQLDDALQTAKAQVTAMAVQIGVAIAGPLTEFLTWSQGVVSTIIAWIKAHPNLVAGVAAVTTVVAGVSAATLAFGTALTIITAHPIIAALALIAAGVVAVASYFSDATDSATEFSGALDGVNKKTPGGSAPQADIAKIQAQSAALQAQISAAPTVQNVTMDQAAMAALERTLGKDMMRTAEYTERSAMALEWIVQQMRSGRGGGFPVGAF